MRSIIQQEGKIDEDVNHGVQVGWVKWRSTSGVLHDRCIPLKLKEKFNKSAIKASYTIWNRVLGNTETTCE